ncbi:MAG: Hsp33 family molecular chaperone HslO [Pseudomonadota bacterium]|nr:Hsp33 family molecular chaperone HslO [Pseudomonadota bacterium]
MPPKSSFSDSVSRFVFEAGAVRGAVVSLDACRTEIIACHPYPPAIARVLSELLAASALLASTLKFNGSLIVQLQGEGPLRLLVVECDADLNLRATAQWKADIEALPDGAALAVLAGGPQRGRLAITLDPRNGEPIYQGIVALEATDIASLIQHYLETSEQISSRLLITSNADRVRGLLLQRLPGGTESDDLLWRHAQERMGSLDTGALAGSSSVAAFLTSQFPEDDLRLFNSHPARFACSCSQERVENALRIVGQVEVEDILAEQGEVSVTCEFCNRRYAFAPADARAVFAEPRLHEGVATQVRTDPR